MYIGPVSHPFKCGWAAFPTAGAGCHMISLIFPCIFFHDDTCEADCSANLIFIMENVIS